MALGYRGTPLYRLLLQLPDDSGHAKETVYGYQQDVVVCGVQQHLEGGDRKGWGYRHPESGMRNRASLTARSLLFLIHVSLPDPWEPRSVSVDVLA
ncbi:unnamed protein product [Boreogadus saida]